MKILELNLQAFGPFTETLLDLSSGTEGLHIVYGPNEAGKSSALRALTQLLYGIPHNSPDDFIHPHKKMRIRGKLRRSDGTMLEIIRRKGRINTLRAADDSSVIEESYLQTFLGGADESVFTIRFGIDHAGLVEGGKKIIEGGGDIGQILFAAGSGISDLRKIQSDLQSEAEALFKPAAQKPRINEAISSLKDRQKAVREAQLPDQEWEQHKNALDKAVCEKKSLEIRSDQNHKERNRLERIKEAFPAMVRRNELLSESETYKDAVLLSEDFKEKRLEALTNLRIAENEEKQAAKTLDEIRQSLHELDIPQTLLENADLIQELYQELGSYRKAMKDRLRLEGLRSSAKSEAASILRRFRSDLSLEYADQIHLETAESISIRELGTEYERLITRLKTTQEEMTKLSLITDRLKKQLAESHEPPDCDELIRAAENARQQGDPESQYESECDSIRKAEAALEISLRKLTLWTGSPEALEQLPVPSLETIETFEHSLRQSEDEIKKQQTEIGNMERSLTETEAQIEALRIEQEVPTENDLIQVRNTRDELWQKVRMTEFPLGNELAEKYGSSVIYADKIADRLRREANRVTKKASLLAERGKQRIHLSRLKESLEKSGNVYTELREEWAAIWEPVGISPKSPREMRAWAQKQAALADQISMIRELTLKAQEMKTRIDRHRHELSECLKRGSGFGVRGSGAETESLRDIILISRNLIDRAAKSRAERDKLRSDLAQREDAFQEAAAREKKTLLELSDWRRQWLKAVQPLGLDADATPAQANAVADDVRNLSVKLNEAEVLLKRINGIDRDAEDFAEKAGILIRREVPEIERLPLEQSVTELNSRLRRALEAKTQQNSLEKQASHSEKQLRSARSKISEIQARLAAMCEEAGCKDYNDLPEAEERSERRRRFSAEYEQIESQLRKLSAGAALDDFIRDAATIDPDSIDPQISRLTEEATALNQEKSLLDQIIGREDGELGKMNGSPRAAEIEEEVQGILARLESDAEQYARLRLASAVLSQSIERYREKNQGPILTRSDELFSRMTLGSFEGLRLDFNEKGETVLKGVRQHELVDVSGMSEGTSDQLYLAIRLASLEAYLEKNEPIPFIVDDILIQFDDERSAAALLVLAELSTRTQIIFFTHHRHLMELAEKLMDPGVLFTHYLGSEK